MARTRRRRPGAASLWQPLATPRCSPSPVEPLRLDFRPPLDAERLLGFLAPRALPGIEEVDGCAYRRPRDGVELRIEERAVTLVGGLDGTVDRARSLLDLDADPDAIGR